MKQKGINFKINQSNGNIELHQNHEVIGDIIIMSQPLDGSSFIVSDRTDTFFSKTLHNAKQVLINSHLLSVLSFQNS